MNLGINDKKEAELVKNCNYRQSRTKKKLLEERWKGKKFLLWKLTSTQKQDIEELGYIVEPFIYQIETRTFHNVRNLPSTLLKDLHYAKKRDKRYLARPLKQNEIELLKEYGVKYRVLKYKIYLSK